MKRQATLFFTLTAALLAPLPSAAEEDGLTLMERGAQLFLEGILKEVEPAMEDLKDLAEEMEPALKDFANSMGPALADLLDQVEDWSAYEAPEILPNGDIILRKKVAEETPPENGDIEL